MNHVYRPNPLFIFDLLYFNVATHVPSVFLLSLGLLLTFQVCSLSVLAAIEVLLMI